jgi:rRNA-processing protein FCF1
MVDANILNCLDADPESLAELSNRRDIILLVSTAQAAEIGAITDPHLRQRLVSILHEHCHRLATPHSLHQPLAAADDILVAASTSCDLLISQDRAVREKAMMAGIRAMDWNSFIRRVLWSPPRKH